MWVTAAAALLQLVAQQITQNDAMLPSTIFTLVGCMVILAARWLAARGAAETAALFTVGGLIGALVLTAIIIWPPLIAIMLAILVIAAIALTILDSRWMNIALGLCAITGIGMTAFHLLQGGQQLQQVLLDERTLGIGLTWLTIGFVLWILWSFRQRLGALLADFEQANHQLTSSHLSLSGQNEWLTYTLHSLGDAVIVADRCGLITIMNGAAETLTGWSQREALGRPLSGVVLLVDQLTQQPLPDLVRIVQECRQMVSFRSSDNILIHGRKRPARSVTATIAPIFDQGGALLGTTLVLADITMARRTQEALRLSEQRFATVFQSQLVGIILISLDEMRIIDINGHALSMLGHHRHALVGHTLAEVDLGIPPRSARALFRLLRWRHAIYRIELPFRTAGGTIREMQASLELIESIAEPYIILIGQDVTEKKMTELALRESESMYRLIAENSHDLIALLDDQARYLFASPSHQRILGIHVAHLIGTSLFDAIYPDDREALRQHWRSLLRVERQLDTMRLCHADGSLRWFEIQSTLIEEAGVRTVVLVARDTTQRRALEAQFYQSQKMESIGRLAGSVAHDFNNMLSAIIGYTELALDDLPRDSTLYHDLIEIQRASNRAMGLSRQLLAFSRRHVIESQVVNLNDTIYELDKMLRRLLGEDIELVTLLTPDPCTCRVEPGQIEQVLINLAVNARDAMPWGGKLLIETKLHLAGSPDLAIQLGGGHEYVASIRVADTGVGMSPDVLQQAFEPFFTTKPAGTGTGLGLATCYGIIKQHNGSIQLESAIGEGTAVTIFLPATTAAVTPRPASEALAQPYGGSETILVAEDEASVREIVLRVLRSQGYTVLDATNGEEALRVAERYDGAIHLLLSDLVMPQMSGTILAQRLRELRPDIRVLFMSGYPGSTVTQQGALLVASSFIQKPFSVAALALKVREVLDREREASA